VLQDGEIRRAHRLEALDGLLPALFEALDVREVFARISEIAKAVLPHDAVGLPLVTEDREHIVPYASIGLTHAVTFDVLRIPDYVRIRFTEPWDFELFRDLETENSPLAGPYLQWGFRSAIRVPIQLKGQIAGLLVFFARAPEVYSEDDVPIVRRIAMFVALALSHQRLADQARRSEAMRERAANLEMLEELLKTLAGALDIRDVFDRVSDIAQKVLPHDATIVIVPTGDGATSQNYALRGFGDTPITVEGRVREPELLNEPWDFRIYDDLAALPVYDDTLAVRAGMHGALLLPVRIDGRLHAFLSFLSRAVSRFTKDDVMVGRRIADHVALAMSHQRLADEARRHDELRARTEKVELLDEVLASVTGAGELPDVFGRVSSVTQKVMPHDCLVLTSILADGLKARVYASDSSEKSPWPDIVDVPPLMQANPGWEFDLVDDIQAQPDQRGLEAWRRGYRAALRVPIRLDGEYVAGVSFLSFTAGKYTAADVPVARRIADRLALSFLRERRNAASQRADAADARAAKLESRVRALTEELDARTGYRRVVGDSVPWRQVLTQATQVAATETTVLLLGESGTGKEVVARFVHRASSRKDGPFVALNCAALPEQLLEAELFGYERGAFTGAAQSKPGQLEQAGGGTLFLDEVGEMSPQVQAKFLRVLQEREFQRLGGTRVLRTDARVVAATNRDLQRAIGRGQFREDLYYRLHVFAIHLPPLRERKEDVLPLSEAFLAEYGRSLGRPPSGISRDARKQLLDYHWPGNVRELRNILERAAILCDGGLITAEHLALTPPPPAPPALQEVAAPAPHAGLPAPAAAPPASARSSPPPGGIPPSPTSVGDLSAMERAMIEQALQNARFNKSKAAAALGLTRAQLYVRMKRYGLE
jgi:two-component system response regulator FlrC